MLDPSALIPFDRRPLPRQVADAVEQLIVTGGLQAGGRLPSEAALAERLGVGRSTVREALGHLERAGIIERRWGVGTLVTSVPPAAMGLEVLESLEALADRQGWVCGTVDLHIASGPADETQARRLGVEPGDPVSVVSRTKTRDGRPVARMTSVVAERVLSHAELTSRFRDSITDLVRALPGAPLRQARAEVRAAPAGRALAQQLGLRRGAPMLVIDEEFRDADAEVLAWNVLELVPGGIRVEVVRRT